MSTNKSVAERFFSRVDKWETCWIWNGAMSGKYGSVTVNSKTITAHRLSYILAHGSIPAGLVIDHLCKNTACVNPDHLEAVTARENLLRGDSIQAVNAKKTHCLRGHPLSENNLSRLSGNRRSCRACRAKHNREWKVTNAR